MREHTRASHAQAGEIVRAIDRENAVADHDIKLVVVRIQRADNRIACENRGRTLDFHSRK